MRHVGCFKLLSSEQLVVVQNKLCGFSWRGGRRFKCLFVHCFLLWYLILSSGKNLFVREIFCNTKHWPNPEQVRWYTRNVGISISSKLCCLLPKSVGIYLEDMKQRKGCFKGSKPVGIFLWFLFIIKYTQRTRESPGGGLYPVRFWP